MPMPAVAPFAADPRGFLRALFDAAVAQARDYLRSVGYRARGWPLS